LAALRTSRKSLSHKQVDGLSFLRLPTSLCAARPPSAVGVPASAGRQPNTLRTAGLQRSWWHVTVVGVLTLLLFPFLGASWPLSLTLHNFGTLPHGAYPRLELTFLYPAMLVNYLTASLMLLLIGERLGWFDRRWAIPLAVALVVVAFFALTPGFGGLLFVVGAWLWYLNRQRYPWAARLALAAGCFMPIAGTLLASVTPIMHPTATFLIHLPGLPPLASSVRFLAWTEAVQNFLSSPILGHGIGVQTVNVDYEASGCSVGCVTDAHNTFLNVAVQLGVLGLFALFAFVWSVSRRMAPPPAPSPRGPLVFGLSAAWLSGFALQGLVGSFEDARHLWIVLGLIWAAESLTKPVASGRNPAADYLAR